MVPKTTSKSGPRVSERAYSAGVGPARARPNQPPPAKDTLFDAEFMERLEYLKLMATRMLPSRHRGEHRARKRGSGIELADYRPYVDGDDTRDVDWKAFLRLDKLVLRIFDEEADLPVYLFVDRSASMAFGDPPKFDFARRMAGALSYIGLMNHDLVSIVWYDGRITGVMPPKRGRNQVFRAFRFLDAGATGGETSLSTCFRAFFGSKRKRGLAVVLSDLMDGEGLLGAFDACRYQKHDLFVVQVLSPEETDPALPDEALLTDAEDGSERRVRVTPRLLARYREALEEHRRKVEDYCSRYGFGFALADSAKPFEDAVLSIFMQDRFLR